MAPSIQLLTWKGAEQRQMISHTPARDMPPMKGFQSTRTLQSVLSLSEGRTCALHSRSNTNAVQTTDAGGAWEDRAQLPPSQVRSEP